MSVPVSLAQEAVEKARQIALEIIPPPDHEPDCPIFDGEGSRRPRVCGDRRYCHAQIDYDQSVAEGSMRIADALVEAQVSALESVAKEMCYWCSTRQVPCGHVDCPALAATDFVARLRGTGGQS